MKRRNAESGKIRRPVKRTKIGEGIYGSTFLYVKFLVVWALVLLADFLLEFRFEYLWPFWLLLRSVYDSFKYQGLAFCVFFVFIAFTSDMICFLFIPVHWLFFAASTYVWVQYVWHTERGICLPTISLWLLFVYIEASVRLRELKNLPFHLDLCRPFAAHCIGYPVVTLGFGFKSYVGYRMRLRKQKEVAKENEFYLQLLQQALPPEAPSIGGICLPTEKDNKPSKGGGEEIISNGHCISNQNHASKKSVCANISNSGGTPNSTQNNSVGALLSLPGITGNGTYAEMDTRESRKHSVCNNSTSTQGIDKHDYQYMETQLSKPTKSIINNFEESDESCEREKTTFKSNGVAPCSTPVGRGSNHKWNHSNSVKDNLSVSHTGSSKKNKTSLKEITANNINSQKDDPTYRLEADIKRLKADLQASRQCEQDLRSQIHGITIGERSVKNELAQLQQDNESLQNKLHNLVTARQQDKQTITQLEKRYQEERKLRTLFESQLAAERKAKKAEEAAAARAVAMATARTECTENCKSRRRDLENDMRQLRRDIKIRDEKIQQMERQVQSLSSYQENITTSQARAKDMKALEEKNANLELSLNELTRLRLDLLAALSDTRKQLESYRIEVIVKEQEIDGLNQEINGLNQEINGLKSKIAEAMAVMPVTSSPSYPQSSPAITLSSGIVSSLLYSPKYIGEEKVTKSTLDPNASVYTPKVVPSDM